MFVGHFAVAFAARPAAPRISLPVLFVAVQFADILWPVFVLTGLEKSRIVPGITAAVPLDLMEIGYSHSLVMTLVWSLVFSAWFLVKRRYVDAAIVGACVFSHFVLDVVTHRPDMPLTPTGPERWGLGLWNYLLVSMIVEGLLFALGVFVYVRGTRATGKMGTVGLAGLVFVLTASWFAGTFGPPPPSIEAMTASTLFVMPFLIAWAWAIDRARPIVATGAS